MVPLQADLPPHRTSLCPYARHRRRPPRRMSRSRHKKIQHRFRCVLEPNARNQPARKPNTGFHPLQRLRSTIPPMPFLQTRFPLRRNNPFHRQRHPRRHHLPRFRLQTPFLHVERGSPTRTRDPYANIQVLRRPPRLRRQQLREPHPADERLWTSMSWAQRSR